MKLYKKIVDEIAKQLAEDGMRAVIKAYETAGFTNRTYNLADSYGSAVYIDGKLIENSVFYFNPKATKSKKWYGRVTTGHEELLSFLRSYKSSPKGIQLLVVASMPYGIILENGWSNLRGKYQVISGATSEMEALTHKYKGTLKSFGIL